MRAIVGADGRGRCPWGATDPLLRDYHDSEWGVPAAGEQAYFERLSLEAFQAGLSWKTVLIKRPQLRVAFRGFAVDEVATMPDNDLEALLKDPGVIRNRAKIFAIRHNAQAVVGLRSHGGLVELIEAHRPAESPMHTDSEEVAPITAASTALSKSLKGAGLKFVGPTTSQALIEELGLIDPHLIGCHRRDSSPR